jgi:hypothetical protein
VPLRCSNGLRSQLHRNFGKMYLSQGKLDDALRSLAQDAYFSSLDAGPDSVATAGAFFHMAAAFIAKVCCAAVCVPAINAPRGDLISAYFCPSPYVKVEEKGRMGVSQGPGHPVPHLRAFPVLAVTCSHVGCSDGTACEGQRLCFLHARPCNQNYVQSAQRVCSLKRLCTKYYKPMHPYDLCRTTLKLAWQCLIRLWTHGTSTSQL